MKISLLSPDISSNALGRAYVLAKVLRRKYEVEIIGPAFSGTVWEPLAKSALDYKLIQMGRTLKHIPQLRKLFKLITGDVVYVSKPLFTSYGVGLVKKLRSRRPLVLDIDDWEWGFSKASLLRFPAKQKVRYLLASALHPHVTNSYWNGFIFERVTRFADAITVSNRFLKTKFGGSIVWHGRDTNAFRPDLFDRDDLRRRYRLDPQAKVVMFFGTIHPYKGVEDLIKAVATLDIPNLKLVLAGVTVGQHSRDTIELATTLLGSRVQIFGIQPFESVPEFMSMADLVVVPQRKTSATIGQIPAKLFDAMAMGKPIISTIVSDIPEILDGCGWVVEPESPESLRVAIDNAITYPKQADEYGRLAREKCVAMYSWNSMEKTLLNVFRRYEA